jgi:hypothetical protein
MSAWDVFLGPNPTGSSYQNQTAGLMSKASITNRFSNSTADYGVNDIKNPDNGVQLTVDSSKEDVDAFIRSVHNGASFSNEAVELLFSFVVAAGKNDGIIWEGSNLGWFCSGNLTNKEASFGARSNARTGEGPDYVSTAKEVPVTETWPDRTTANTPVYAAGSGELVTATFSHDMKYNGSFPLPVATPAVTKETYTIAMTITGTATTAVITPATGSWSGTWTPTKDGDYTETHLTPPGTHTYLIQMPTLEPGAASQTLTICEQVNYADRTFNDETKKWEGGASYSKACANFTVGGPIIIPPSGGCTNTEAGLDYGNTSAYSAVINLSKSGSSWIKTVEGDKTASATPSMTTNVSNSVYTWAKPGDSIQFQHKMCWGVQKVRGSSGAGARTINPASGNTFTINSRAFPANGASGTGNYLFGKTLTGNNTVTKTVSAGQATSTSFSTVPAGDKGDYYATIYSPSNDTYDYKCYSGISDNFPTFKQGGYQIPDFKTTPTTCHKPSAVSNNNAGQIIEQTLDWTNVKSWVKEHWSNKSGSCGCGTNSRTVTNTPNNYDYAKNPGTNLGHSVYNCTTSGCCGWCCRTTNYANNDDYVYYPIDTSTAVGAKKTAQVKIPYNYTTTVTTSKLTDPAYAGETLRGTATIKINERANTT